MFGTSTPPLLDSPFTTGSGVEFLPADEDFLLLCWPVESSESGDDGDNKIISTLKKCPSSVVYH